MADPKQTASKPAKGKVPALRVVARRDSFRRIGRRFGAEPVDIPLSELKKAEIEALRADRLLVVHEVEIDGGEAAADPAAQNT
ncbi:MAG: hypothetical protein AB7I35_12275 [Ramlibacter sp.]|nr:hypothetical protein [Ramlibacter sp.]